MSTDPDDIRGWQRLSGEVTTSGRLRPADPARLAAIGVQQVINLAFDEHPDALSGERELLAAAGIDYTHIPIAFAVPEEADYAAFKAALAAAVGPVHVHCIMNWRVSALFYRLHREQGMAEAEARALMQQQWDPFAGEPEIEPDIAHAWAELISR